MLKMSFFRQVIPIKWICLDKLRTIHARAFQASNFGFGGEIQSRRLA